MLDSIDEIEVPDCDCGYAKSDIFRTRLMNNSERIVELVNSMPLLGVWDEEAMYERCQEIMELVEENVELRADDE